MVETVACRAVSRGIDRPDRTAGRGDRDRARPRKIGATAYAVAVAAVLALVLLAAPAAQAQGEGGAGGGDTPAGQEAAAAEGTGAEAAEDDPLTFPYEDELQRDTPRGATIGFLAAGRAGDWERAARYLDLSRLSDEEAADRAGELARRLKRVMDRQLWVEPLELSDRPAGHTDDGLPDGADRVGVIESAEGEVPIQLRRVRQEDAEVWKISAATVARIDALYDEFGYGPLERWLPTPFFEIQLFEIQLWQWIGLVVVLLAAWLLSWVGARLVMAVIVPLASRTATTMDDRLLGDGAPPLRFLIGLGLFSLGVMALRLSVPAEQFFLDVVQALVVLSVIWLAFRIVDIFSEWGRQRLMDGGQETAVSLLPLGRRTVKVALGALGVLAVLENLGVNVTALIAGLGVGGLAVALAAQKTLENLFGGITLAVDQPVRVGEFCRFGDKLGTVEDIGLRSTRVRTLDRTVVTVPNSDFSGMQIENFATRDRMRLNLTLGLRYETTADQLRYVLVEIRRLLLSHPMVTADPARVRFAGFGASSLDVEIFAYVDTPDYNEFLAVREDLFLRLMDIVEESGSDFAFPSTTTYIERGGGLDDDKVSAAEAQVRAWREAGELQLPHFEETLVAELDDTLEYPPEGSAVHASRRAGKPGAEE